MSRPRDDGTGEVRRQEHICDIAGLPHTRLAEQGINDRGDFTIDLPGFEVVVEAKKRNRLNVHATLEKAVRKAGHDRAVVWWRRVEKPVGGRNRVQVGSPVVAMSEGFFMELLRKVGSDEV